MIQNLGVHATKESIQRLRHYTNLFQISLHDARFFEFYYNKIKASVYEWRRICPDAFFVVHGPYLTNIMIDNKVLKSSVQSIRNHLDACLILGAPYLVVHPGTRNFKGECGTKEIPLEDSVRHTKKVLKFIMKDYRGKSVRLLLENMSNTNLKGFPMDKLIEIADELSPEVGLCFDTEHAYARGEDIKKFEVFMERADVIHFNPIPSYVNPGSGVDQHTYTSLNESVGIPPKILKKWLVKFKHKIKIMELDGQVAEGTLQTLLEENQNGKLRELVNA